MPSINDKLCELEEIQWRIDNIIRLKILRARAKRDQIFLIQTVYYFTNLFRPECVMVGQLRRAMHVGITVS